MNFKFQVLVAATSFCDAIVRNFGVNNIFLMKELVIADVLGGSSDVAISLVYSESLAAASMVGLIYVW
jgi:hypothetical protein